MSYRFDPDHIAGQTHGSVCMSTRRTLQYLITMLHQPRDYNKITSIKNLTATFRTFGAVTRHIKTALISLDADYYKQDPYYYVNIQQDP